MVLQEHLGAGSEPAGVEAEQVVVLHQRRLAPTQRLGQRTAGRTGTARVAREQTLRGARGSQIRRSNLDVALGGVVPVQRHGDRGALRGEVLRRGAIAPGPWPVGGQTQVAVDRVLQPSRHGGLRGWRQHRYGGEQRHRRHHQHRYPTTEPTRHRATPRESTSTPGRERRPSSVTAGSSFDQTSREKSRSARDPQARPRALRTRSAPVSPVDEGLGRQPEAGGERDQRLGADGLGLDEPQQAVGTLPTAET